MWLFVGGLGCSSKEAPANKDASVPVHAGAAAYIDGTERTFVEKYSDYFWGGLLVFSGLGSAGAWFRAFFRRDEKSLHLHLKIDDSSSIVAWILKPITYSDSSSKTVSKSLEIKKKFVDHLFTT